MSGVPSEILTVVMPAYNEEGAIRDAVADVQQRVLAVVPGASLIVVNDGSRDRTGQILDGIAAADERVRVIHQPNGGHGLALRAGMEVAGGTFLFLIDSDRQIPLNGFAAAWSTAARHDAVFGVRQGRDDPALRLWLTRVIRLVLAVLFLRRMPDANAPFKIFRRELWQAARPFIPAGTLAPSLFLAVVAYQRRADVVTVLVSHQRRRTGEVSIRRWKLLRFCWRGWIQLLRLRVELLRSPALRQSGAKQRNR